MTKTNLNEILSIRLEQTYFQVKSKVFYAYTDVSISLQTLFKITQNRSFAIEIDGLLVING